MDYPDSNLLMQHSFEHHWDSETAERWNSDCVSDGESPVFLERFAIVFRSRELFGLNLARCNLCPIRAAVESLSSQIHWLNIGLVQVETGKQLNNELDGGHQVLLVIGISVGQSDPHDLLKTHLLLNKHMSLGIDAWLALKARFPGWSSKLENALLRSLQRENGLILSNHYDASSNYLSAHLKGPFDVP